MAGSSSANLIELKDIQKYYTTGKVEYHALRGVNLSITQGELVAIAAPRQTKAMELWVTMKSRTWASPRFLIRSSTVRLAVTRNGMKLRTAMGL